VASAAARVELARLREELRVETEARETLQQQQAAASGAGGAGGAGEGPELGVAWLAAPMLGHRPQSPPPRGLHAPAPATLPRASATKGEGRRAARGNPSPRRSVAGVEEADA